MGLTETHREAERRRWEEQFLYAVYFSLAFFLIVFPAVTPDGIYGGVYFLLSKILVVAWAITGIYCIAACIPAVRVGASRRAVLLALLSLPAIAGTANWGQAYGNVADWEHFSVMRAHYDQQVARLPDSGERFAEFNWGGLSFPSRGVVYDETDEIGLPPNQQSRRWVSRMKNTDLLCGEQKFEALFQSFGDHYYEVGFGC